MVNRLLLEKAHVSKVVKKLQIMGLIDILPFPGDKRSALLSPTAKGQKLVDECRTISKNGIKNGLNDLMLMSCFKFWMAMVSCRNPSLPTIQNR